MAARLIHQWRNQLADYRSFTQRYANCAEHWTLGQRRSYIRSTLVSLNGRDGYACRVEDGELLRRFFDDSYDIPINPDDCTLHKYSHLEDVFSLSSPQPKKARSIMDKNLAALLRADARTVHVKLVMTGEERANGSRTKVYTYVSHLPLAKDDWVVVVDAAGALRVGLVNNIDDEAKIEPGCDTEYKWVIGKIDMTAHTENEHRNAEIAAEAAVIVRENMRKSFAAQVLGAASEEQRNKLLQLTGNAG